MKIADLSTIKLTTPVQKLFAGVMAVGFLLLLNWALPAINIFFKNMYVAIFLGVPLACIIGYTVYNPMMVWSIFTRMSWALTKKLISSDRIGYLYRYYDYFLVRNKALEGNIVEVTSAKVELQRAIGETSDKLETNKQSAITMEGKDKYKSALLMIQNQIDVDDKLIKSYLPRVSFIEDQEKNLLEILENRTVEANNLKYQIDAKVQEYKLMQKVNSASNNAKATLDKNSPAYKMFSESVSQMEVAISKYTSNIQVLDRQMAPLLQQMNSNKEASAERGRKLVEMYKNTKLELPAA